MNHFFAITGCSGSGKSTVCRLLESKYGATVIDADAIAREVVLPGTDCLQKITKEFGSKILTAKGELDRKSLGLLIFKDKKKKLKLEQILHPAIRALFDIKLQEVFSTNKHSIIFYDIPLYFEVNYQHPLCKGVIVVYAPPDTCKKRIMKRDSIPEQAAINRIQAQIPIEEKVEKADYVVKNDTTDDLESQMEDLINWCKKTATT
jgi:dephospho-CoA kinase